MVKTVSFLILVFIYFPSTFAATETSILYRTNDDLPAPPNSGWSVLIPSFVIHGISPSPEGSQAMPRKLDPEGNTVITPGAGLEYVNSNGVMILAAVFKDCYNDLAGTFQFGQFFHLRGSMKFGVSAGLYARETPLSCQQKRQPNGELIEECENLENISKNFMTTINGESVDLIPMPFVHFASTLYKDRHLQVDFRLMTNIALNEFGISIPF